MKCYMKHILRLFQLKFLCVCVCVCVCSITSDSLTTPWIIAHQAPLSMEFSRQEYGSGLSFPPAGDLIKPGIKPTSPLSPELAGGFFITEPKDIKNVA